MSEPDPNVQRVLRSMYAFNENDIEGVKEVFREDMVYRVAGRSPIGGVHHGIDLMSPGYNTQQRGGLNRGTDRE
jgi:ketosteroid isomerase-like protein